MRIDQAGRKRLTRGVWAATLLLSLMSPLHVAGQGGAAAGLSGLSQSDIQALSEKYRDPNAAQAMPSGLGQPGNRSSMGAEQTRDATQRMDAPRVVKAGIGVIVELGQQPDGDEPRGGKASPVKRIYVVPNNQGQINLDAFGRYEVMGYSADEIVARLSVDPRLSNYDISVKLLPVDTVSVNRLRPFGSDVFGHENIVGRNINENLVPPPGYVYGPGDSFIVQYYGKTNSVYELTVLRDGRLNLPELGPITVAGMTFDDIRDAISQKVSEELIGVNTSISVGALRSIGVLALGEFASPGPLSVPAGASIIDVIIAAGGLLDTASYRKISIRRGGSLVRSIDLYDVLTSSRVGDLQVMQEDVVIVHPAGPRISVLGEVRKPALYELDGAPSVEQVVDMAGGLSDNAAGGFSIERLNARGETDLVTGNLRGADGGLRLQRGDVVRVDRALSRRDNAVVLSGHFENPGYREWREGTTVLDVLPSIREFMPRADLGYLLILRESGPSREVKVLSVDYASIAAGEGGNVTLEARDEIVALPLGEQRAMAMERLLLKVNGARAFRQQPTVTISGAVRFPGVYFYEEGGSVDSLIQKAGGLLESAYEDTAELVRYSVGDDRGRQNVKASFSLADKAERTSLKLMPDDVVNIFSIPNWTEPMFVEVKGEVRFPGRYTITKGERLSDLLERVGGVTKEGYLNGAVFQRERLKEREREELARLRQRLSDDLRAMAVQVEASRDEQEGLMTARRLLQESEGMEPVGRLVIDFDQVADGGSDDVLLSPGDTLVVPPKLETVSVIGEVNMTISHRWRENRSAKEYLELSGGLTQRADDDQVYVVRASGEVRSLDTGWFGTPPDIRPGDTIVVPLDTTAIRPMQLARDITQILSQVAITVAAFNSIGVF